MSEELDNEERKLSKKRKKKKKKKTKRKFFLFKKKNIEDDDYDDDDEEDEFTRFDEDEIVYFPEVELKTDQEKGSDFFKQGAKLKNEGKFSQAILEFSKAIEVDTGNARYYNLRGYCYNKFNNIVKLRKALEDLNKAIELSPNFGSAYNNRGTTYRKMNKLDLSLRDFNKSIELSPKAYHRHNNRGLTYKKMGDIYKAISDYSKELEINPKDHVCLCNRGNAYRELKRYNEAIEDYERAIELKPEYKACIRKLEEARALKEEESESSEEKSSESSSESEEKEEEEEEVVVVVEEEDKIREMEERLRNEMKKMEEEMERKNQKVVEFLKILRDSKAVQDGEIKKNRKKIEESETLIRSLRKKNSDLQELCRDLTSKNEEQSEELQFLKVKYENHFEHFHRTKYQLKSSVSPQLSRKTDQISYCFENETFAFRFEFAVRNISLGSYQQTSPIDFKELKISLNDSPYTQFKIVDNSVEFKIEFTKSGRNTLTCHFENVKKSFVIDVEPLSLCTEKCQLLFYQAEIEPSGPPTRSSQSTDKFRSSELIQLVLKLVNENGVPLLPKFLEEEFLDVKLIKIDGSRRKMIRDVLSRSNNIGIDEIDRKGEFCICSIDEGKLEEGEYLVKVDGCDIGVKKVFEIV